MSASLGSPRSSPSSSARPQQCTCSTSSTPSTHTTGWEFEAHQDSEHRRYGTAEWRDVGGRGSYVQSVVAIDDSTPDTPGTG
ncbi:MAG TPA: hypothetical protein VJA16_12460 [Thermoanaerobaculia bacterium]